MANISEARDCGGRPVYVGSRIRVVQLSDDFIASLPADERGKVIEMVGGLFEVDEIDKFGCAWVTKTWDCGDGSYDAHSVALSSDEMELVSTDGAV